MKDYIAYLPYIWFGIMTLIAYISMGFDKFRAKSGGRRVSEKMLFLLAILGGSVGSIAGMYSFRHKTKHWYFQIGMPLILIIQIAAIVFLRFKFAA